MEENGCKILKVSIEEVEENVWKILEKWNKMGVKDDKRGKV